MKKNRPGVMVTVLCDEARIPALEEILFRETTTLGIRRYPVSRHKLKRQATEVETPFGPIRGKLGWLEDRPPDLQPRVRRLRPDRLGPGRGAPRSLRRGPRGLPGQPARTTTRQSGERSPHRQSTSARSPGHSHSTWQALRPLPYPERRTRSSVRQGRIALMPDHSWPVPLVITLAIVAAVCGAGAALGTNLIVSLRKLRRHGERQTAELARRLRLLESRIRAGRCAGRRIALDREALIWPRADRSPRRRRIGLSRHRRHPPVRPGSQTRSERRP